MAAVKAPGDSLLMVIKQFHIIFVVFQFILRAALYGVDPDSRIEQLAEKVQFVRRDVAGEFRFKAFAESIKEGFAGGIAQFGMWVKVIKE